MNRQDELTKQDIEEHEMDLFCLRPRPLQQIPYEIIYGPMNQLRLDIIRQEGEMLQRFARTFG